MNNTAKATNPETVKPQLEGNDAPAKLVLEDGTAFSGRAFGAVGYAIGEVVFNTGMTGYEEVITDPSYRGQIVAFTYPELGNTGINEYDQESGQAMPQAVIARNICHAPSNWRCRGGYTLSQYLRDRNIPGIYDLDTRALTRHLRSRGAMNGIVASDALDENRLLERVKEAPDMRGSNFVDQVTTPNPYCWWIPSLLDWECQDPSPNLQGNRLTVVAIDFGIKRNILRRLASYGCRVMVVPADASAEEIRSYEPDGIFLSNGPGDPATVTQGIETVKSLLETEIPIFGICMGHQILGLALGGRTQKLPFGHHGLNHPCGMLQESLAITSQNHGFALDFDSLPKEVEVTEFNLNDKTVAGLKHKLKPVFSVQYHPEGSPGPHDPDGLFGQFVEMMRL
jgi:carbamoyl-phosphate synthase small subunit